MTGSRVVFAALFILVLLSVGRVPAAGPAKTRIAIIELEAVNDAAKNGNKGRMASEILTTAAVKSGVFEVVERHLIEKVLAEMEYGSDAASGGTAQKIGELVGAQAVLSGSVAQYHDKLRIDARLVKVADGRILLAEDARAGDSLDGVEEAAGKIMRKIVAVLDPEAAARRAGVEDDPGRAARTEGAASLAGARFARDEQGVVTDARTGLQWAPSREGGFDWEQAKAWVAGLKAAGGGWRMPTRSELAGLKTDRQGGWKERPQGCWCDPLFVSPELRSKGWCPWAWSDDGRDTASAWGFSFSAGKEFRGDRDPAVNNGRGFAVRVKR